MGGLKVGVGTRDVTPSAQLLAAGRIWLWGYGDRTGPSFVVNDPLSARAMAIRDEAGTTVVLVGVDSGALDPTMTASIRARVERSRSLPPEYVCINVSHTHSAPVSAAIAGWQPGVDVPDPDYVTFLEDSIVAAIEAAVDGVQPATLAFARGVTTAGYDRHFPNTFDLPYRHDPTLDVIRATDHAGDVIGVVFVAACHPVCGEHGGVSADFVGLARHRIEEAVGGIAIFLQGYAGISLCKKFDLEFIGETVAVEVKSVLDGPMDDLDGQLDAWLSTIELPFQPLPDADMRRQATADGGENARWAASMERLGPAIPAALPTQLQAFRIGLPPNDWYLVASSHEVSADLAGAVRGIWPHDRTTVVGYSNSQLSYLPSRLVLNNPLFPNFPFSGSGGVVNYEGGHSFALYGHRAPLTDEVDELFIAGHVGLLDGGWEHIGHATDVVAMTGWQGKLYAVTSNGLLWWRKTIAQDVAWSHMGHATDVVGLAAVAGSLFCATSDGKLWRRERYGFDLPWAHIGHATDIRAMAGLHGRLFAATGDGELWWREPDLVDIPWIHIGHARDVAGMAATSDRLFAATDAGLLWWRDPVGHDVPWNHIGTADLITSMAGLDGMLYATTREGKLLRRMP